MEDAYMGSDARIKNDCEMEWTTINGVNGVKFTGSNGRYIFLSDARVSVVV